VLSRPLNARSGASMWKRTTLVRRIHSITRVCRMLQVVLLALLHQTAAHSSLISPISRNAVDRVLAPWSNGTFGNNRSCAHPAWENTTYKRFGTCWVRIFVVYTRYLFSSLPLPLQGCNCVNGTHKCDVAQTCVWFSQGCSIGCKKCDGGESNPNYRDRCGSGMKPTNNDPYFRTLNQNATAMSKDDLYQHNPWRAPGNAPVYDACGSKCSAPASPQNHSLTRAALPSFVELRVIHFVSGWWLTKVCEHRAVVCRHYFREAG
jgi:hypothetical protein